MKVLENTTLLHDTQELNLYPGSTCTVPPEVPCSLWLKSSFSVWPCNSEEISLKTKHVSGPGVLTFSDGGPGGGVSHEGLFETSQLTRRENSQGAVQRAQAAAAKARALAMWPGLQRPRCPDTWTVILQSESFRFLHASVSVTTNHVFKTFVFISSFLNPAVFSEVETKAPVVSCVCVILRWDSHWFRISWANNKLNCSVITTVLNALQAESV